jgi:hypothetical protein
MYAIIFNPRDKQLKALVDRKICLASLRKKKMKE